MMNELARLKPAIVHELEQFLARTKIEAGFVSPWTSDVMDRLLDYTTRGKMIRGALVTMGARIFSGTETELRPDLELVCLKIGAAMELIQSLLLIHDDIMDQDDMRRGKPSVHAQYIHLSQQKNADNPKQLGESLGICAGDVSGFLAFEIIAALDLPAALLRELMALTSRELTFVGLAQMSDVFNGGVNTEPDFEDIIRLYRYKTGRYTFSLPLMAGALCAGADAETRLVLAELGEMFGIIFQVKDDDLGLFGDSSLTGKPVGSDIVENKKTLHRHFLLEHSDVSQRKVLHAIFGKRGATHDEIAMVIKSMESSGVRDLINRELDLYAQQARTLIATLSGVSNWGKSALEGLLAYNLDREV